MWSVDRPLVLLLLALVPFGFYFRHFWPGRGGRIRFPFQIYGADGFRPARTGLGLGRFATAALFWVGLVTLVVGLAGPVRVYRERVYLSPGISMVLVLDESPSMAARDMGEFTRFESARRLMQRFAAGRENDAVGVVSFALRAAVRLPPTADRDALNRVVDDLSLMDLGDGTAIGDGLALGALALGDTAEGERVMVLMTDGVNNAGEVSPREAVGIAEEMGIRIYTIGIGGEDEAPIEFTDPETGRTHRGLVEDVFDEDFLREAAERTGGRYFHADSDGALEAVFRSIDGLEAVERHARIEVHTVPVDRWVVFAGFLALLGSIVMRYLVLREIL